MATVSSRADVAVFNELAAIDRLAAIHIERLLPGQMSAAQFGVLSRLVSDGPQTPTDLAKGLALSKATMSHALARLAAARLIVLAADADDGRRKQVSLTAAGEKAFLQGSGALSPMMLALRTSFPAEDFEAALPFLTRLRAWLQNGALT
jgi:DNA-binding MarR family transcriptional regulator